MNAFTRAVYCLVFITSTTWALTACRGPAGHDGASVQGDAAPPPEDTSVVVIVPGKYQSCGHKSCRFTIHPDGSISHD